MAETYKTLYGWDWPKEMSDELIGLVVGKKWREYKSEFGFEFKDPWDPMLKSMVSLYGRDNFKVSEWTEQHVHDWVMEDMPVTIGCAASGKSNDTGAILVADGIVDPYDTVAHVGSTTRDALKLRTWESIERYFSILKNHPRFSIPWKLVPTSCAMPTPTWSNKCLPSASRRAASASSCCLPTATVRRPSSVWPTR